MTTYKVDYDIPIPAARRRGSYPFADMKPGGSFAVPCTPADQQAVIKRIRSAAAHYRRKDGSRYIVRPVMENDQLVVRCWRQKKELR